MLLARFRHTGLTGAHNLASKGGDAIEEICYDPASPRGGFLLDANS